MTFVVDAAQRIKDVLTTIPQPTRIVARKAKVGRAKARKALGILEFVGRVERVRMLDLEPPLRDPNGGFGWRRA